MALMQRQNVPRRVWFLLLGLLLLFVACVLLTRHIYFRDLEAVSNSQEQIVYTVNSGATVKQIADGLEQKHLIRSAWAFQLYVKTKDLGDKLQAGTYAFSPSESTKTIIHTLTSGQVTKRLVTILPGRRIDQVRADLINAGFKPDDVDQALNPNQYSDMPVLAYKPADATTLEGLLWPDSFQKDSSTGPSDIIRESLQETGAHLTPEVQAAFAAEGLTTYQGLTLASIVLQEVNKPADQTQAAQVFMSRIKSGMMLGSDASNRYGAIADGHAPSLTYDSPYNTSQHAGLPPTPISTVNDSSLNAVAHPATTNWLYFVTGDDGTTYFSSNLQDHQALTQKYCHKLCSQE